MKKSWKQDHKKCCCTRLFLNKQNVKKSIVRMWTRAAGLICHLSGRCRPRGRNCCVLDNPHRWNMCRSCMQADAFQWNFVACRSDERKWNQSGLLTSHSEWGADGRGEYALVECVELHFTLKYWSTKGLVDLKLSFGVNASVYARVSLCGLQRQLGLAPDHLWLWWRSAQKWMDGKVEQVKQFPFIHHHHIYAADEMHSVDTFVVIRM